MKKHYLVSILTVFAALVSASGCVPKDILVKSQSDNDNSEWSSSDTDDTPTEVPDEIGDITIDEIRSHAEKLLEDAEISGNEDVLKEDIDILIEDVNIASEILSYSNIAYYCDWLNEELEAEYNEDFETYYVGAELASYAFSNAYCNDEYSELFKDYIREDYLDYYTDRAMSIKRIEGYSKVDCSLSNELIDDYYDVITSDDSDEEKNLKSAEIYLEILKDYSTDSFYDTFNRDFTPGEILKLGNYIQDKIVPLSEKIEYSIWDIPEISEVLDDPIIFDAPFEVIADYGEDISDDIGESAMNLIKDKNYYVKTGDDCYNGSFTIDLSASNDAIVYIHNDNDYYNLLTPIHEFGHYYASFYDNTPDLLIANNIDIKEIHSQGMEMLFMNFYDDIFEEQSNAMKALKIYDIINSITSGFAIGEFEYTALEKLNELTPETLIELFDETLAKYNIDYNLYEVNHIFEQPAYYISYGVSALAAIDIWRVSNDNYDEAVDMYEKISRVKANSSENQFKSVLKECGFSDVLTEEYIQKITSSLSEYIESIA